MNIDTTLRDRKPTLDPEFELVVELPGVICGHFRNVSINLWATQATHPAVDRFEQFCVQVVKRHPQISVVTFITNQAKLPPPDVRTRIDAIADKYASNSNGLALVLDGTGFWASMMRSFLAGIHVVQRRSYPTRIFAHPHDAATWLMPIHAQSTGVSVDSQRLSSLLEQLRLRAIASAP